MARIQSGLRIVSAWFVLCSGFTALSAGAADPRSLPIPSDRTGMPTVIVYTKGPFKDDGFPPAELLNLVQDGKILRVIVGLDFDMVAPHDLSEADAAAQAAKLAALQRKVVSATPALSKAAVLRFQAMPYMGLTVNEAQLRSLLKNPAVRSIREEGIHKAHLDHSTEVIRVDKLWEPPINLTGEGQTVVVIDSGSYHPAMIDESRIVDGACFSRPSVPVIGGTTWPMFCNHWGSWFGCRSACKDYDLHPVTGWPAPKLGKEEGKFCPSGYGKTGREALIYSEYCSHGSHVATIAAGDTPRDNPTLRGVAPKAKVIRMQVFHILYDWERVIGFGNWRDFDQTHLLHTGPSATDIDILGALQQVYNWRHKYNIAAVNMSLGSSCSHPNCWPWMDHCDRRIPAYSDIIGKLTDFGIAVVIAAGNGARRHGDGVVGPPGCVEKAVTVGSTRIFLPPDVPTDDVLSGFSDHSEVVDLLAPGGANFAPNLGINAGIPHPSGDPRYARYPGTSMAAPHVAGAFAVLKEFRPSATVEELETALRCTGEPVARSDISRNRIDLRSAYQFLKDGLTDCNMPDHHPGAPEWLPRHRWF